MSDVEYRTFAPGDVRPLVRAWNEALAVDPVTVDWFTDYVLLDPNFDPEGLVVATADGDVVGAAYAVRRLVPDVGVWLDSESGWIPFFFVRPGHRRAGVGTELLDRAMRFLDEHGCLRVDVASYTPNYFLPGVDPRAHADGHRLLLARGFEVRSTAVAMDKSLQDFAMPADVTALAEKLRGDGYRFASPVEDELPALIAFAATALAPDWGEAIRDALRRGLPLHRLLVAWQGDAVVGFAMYGAYRGIAERFGPYGVAEATRGSGVGKVLLYLTLHAMRAEGLHTAWFLWTSEGTPAAHLYHRAGFAVTRRFDIMRAPL